MNSLSLRFFKSTSLVLAVFQALFLWLLHHLIQSRIWPATQPHWFVPAYLIVIFTPITFYILWPYRSAAILRRWTTYLIFFLLIAGYLGFRDLPALTNDTDLDEARIAGFVIPWIIAWLIGIPLVRTRLESTYWRIPYKVFFRNCGRCYLTLGEASVFVGLFWSLLQLCAALFLTLDINFFEEIFTDPRFAYPATTLALAIAIQIIDNNDELFQTVLNHVLAILKWFLPLSGAIAIIFSIALIPKLPTLLFSGQRIIDSSTLFALVVFNLLFFNAAYREGDTDSIYAPWLQRVLRVIPPLLVLIAITGLYSLSIRIWELGLTPARYWGFMTGIFSVFFSMGYGYASFQKDPWLKTIEAINTRLLVVIFFTLLVSLTPPADPFRLSVSSQINRSINGLTMESTSGALQYLRFDSGERGRRALNGLAQGAYDIPDLDKRSFIQNESKRMLALKSKKDLKSGGGSATPDRYREWRSQLKIIPSSSTIDQQLEDAIRQEFLRSASMLDPIGKKIPSPRLIFVDLDGDEIAEALLLSGALRGDPLQMRDFIAFKISNGGWIRWSSGQWG